MKLTSKVKSITTTTARPRKKNRLLSCCVDQVMIVSFDFPLGGQ